MGLPDSTPISRNQMWFSDFECLGPKKIMEFYFYFLLRKYSNNGVVNVFCLYGIEGHLKTVSTWLSSLVYIKLFGYISYADVYITIIYHNSGHIIDLTCIKIKYFKIAWSILAFIWLLIIKLGQFRQLLARPLWHAE